MQEAVARRYSLDPFDDKLIENLSNPYRRALLLTAIEKIRTEEENILKSLNMSLPEFLKRLIDIAGTAIINTIIGVAPFKKTSDKKRAMIKSLFAETPKTDQVFHFPQKDGSTKAVRIG